MSEAIITVENLGKRYRLGASRSGERYTALRDVMAQKAAAPFRALKVKLERRKEKTNGELTAALRSLIPNFLLPLPTFGLSKTSASK